MPKRHRRDEGAFRALLRSFVRTFPPLKIALLVNDAICCLFSRLVDGVSYLLRNSFKLLHWATTKLFNAVYEPMGWACSKLLSAIPIISTKRGQEPKYEPLLADAERHKKALLHREPIPYQEQLIKRAITYHGGLLLALFLYVFVYFVLVKRHTYTTLSVAFLLMLVYLILIENSHNLRSILMLCLPIMLTNRGRALVFCSMLALLSGGPIKSISFNVREIHSSLNCCKQFLVVRTDKYVGERVVNKLAQVEEVVLDLVGNIKMYARELEAKFDAIVQLAMTTEQFVIDTIRKLRQILEICNRHTDELYANCVRTTNKLFVECRQMFNPFRFGLCLVFNELQGVCGSVRLPQVLCELPRHVVDFFERTVGRKLAEYVEVIKREFYVDVEVNRQFAYNITKSKSYAKSTSELKFDVAKKFWYVDLLRRVFNLVSLILVVWILATATIYHMHYLSEIQYDNMYLDERLHEIEELRKLGLLKLRAREKTLKDEQQAPLEEEEPLKSVRSAALGEDQMDLNNNNNNNNNINQDANNNDINNNVLDSGANLIALGSSDQDDAPEQALEETRPEVDEFDQLLEGHETDTVILDIETDSPPLDGRAKTTETSNHQEMTDKQQDDSLNRKRSQDRKDDDHNNDDDELKQTDYLFPMTGAHEEHYLRPFGLHMNKVEMSKLYWSGLVWLVIIGYIAFFLMLDFALYQLVHFLVETLRAILFTSDLPLVDLETKSTRDPSGPDKVVRYNRTYLGALRKQRTMRTKPVSLAGPGGSQNTPEGTPTTAMAGRHSSSSIQDFYNRLMDSIERDIPDEVAILESLEGCLPNPQVPAYETYKLLLYLSLFTFGAVIMEAYALRTRHCIANLYYPRRARQRALWLYRKLLSEKPKYEAMTTDADDDEAKSKGGQDEGGQEKKAAATAIERKEKLKQQRQQNMEDALTLLTNRIKR